MNPRKDLRGGVPSKVCAINDTPKSYVTSNSVRTLRRNAERKSNLESSIVIERSCRRNRNLDVRSSRFARFVRARARASLDQSDNYACAPARGWEGHRADRNRDDVVYTCIYIYIFFSLSLISFFLSVCLSLGSVCDFITFASR